MDGLKRRIQSFRMYNCSSCISRNISLRRNAHHLMIVGGFLLLASCVYLLHTATARNRRYLSPVRDIDITSDNHLPSPMVLAEIRKSSVPKPQISEENDILQVEKSSAKPQISDENDTLQVRKSSPKPKISEENDTLQVRKSSPKPQISEENDTLQARKSSPKPQISEENDTLQAKSSAKPEVSEENNTPQARNSSAKPQIFEGNDTLQVKTSSPKPQISEEKNDTLQARNSSTKLQISEENNTLQQLQALGKKPKSESRLTSPDYSEERQDGGDDAVCAFPDQDPFHPSVMKHFELFPTLKCNSTIPSLFAIDGNLLRLNATKARTLGIKIDSCRLVFLQRKKNTDFDFEEVVHQSRFLNSTNLPQNQSYFYTACHFQKKLVSRTFFTVIREKKATEERCQINHERHVKQNSPKETLSVLLIGIDGLSRQSFIRSMNKTRQFLMRDLKAIELAKMNVVGENTFPNLVPLLSGRTKTEIMENWPSRDMAKIDSSFLWSDFQKAGYRTAVVLDRANITAFHFLKQGWRNPTFDYYNRPMVLKTEEAWRQTNGSWNCVGPTPEIPFLLDHWLQLTSVFNNSQRRRGRGQSSSVRPYFGFSFLNRLTHNDARLASTGDQHYLEFFQELTARRVLNNTLVVFFSDHGPRFGKTRLTYNGMLESRTPFASFVFPDWFKQKYPRLMDALVTNQHRLTTMFDIHATLRDLVNFQGTTNTNNSSGDEDERNQTSRGISLFREIPLNRTCEQAGIPAEFCLCSSSNLTADTDVSPILRTRLGATVVRHIVALTERVRDACVVLSLASIKGVESMVRNERSGKRIYLVVIETSPGGAIYEATLVTRRRRGSGRGGGGGSGDDRGGAAAAGGGVDGNGSNITLRVVGNPTRLNFYKGQADCMLEEVVKPFCYCKT